MKLVIDLEKIHEVIAKNAFGPKEEKLSESNLQAVIGAAVTESVTRLYRFRNNPEINITDFIISRINDEQAMKQAKCESKGV